MILYVSFHLFACRYKVIIAAVHLVFTTWSRCVYNRHWSWWQFCPHISYKWYSQRPQAPVLIFRLLGRQIEDDISRISSSRLPFFLPGLLLPSQLQSVTALSQYQFILLGKQRHVCERFAQGCWGMARDWTGDIYIASPIPHRFTMPHLISYTALENCSTYGLATKSHSLTFRLLCQLG